MNNKEELFSSIQKFKDSLPRVEIDKNSIPASDFKESLIDPKNYIYTISNINMIILCNPKLDMTDGTMIEANSIELQIPKDKNNKIIYIVLDGKTNLIFNTNKSMLSLQYNSNELLNQNIIKISQIDIEDDILVNSPDQMHEYPLIKTDITEEDNMVKANVSVKLTAFDKFSTLMNVSKSTYIELFNELNLYINNFKANAYKLYKIFENDKPDDSIIIYKNDIYELDSKTMNLKYYCSESNEIFKFYMSMFCATPEDITVINKKYTIYKNNVWYNNNHLSKTQKELLGSDYNSSVYNKFTSLILELNENYSHGNLDIVLDLFKELEKIYNNIIEHLYNVKVYYVSNNYTIDIVNIKQAYLYLKTTVSNLKKEQEDDKKE